MATYRQKRTLLMGLTACVWFAAFALSFHKFGLSARAGIRISLQSSPSAVKVFVDNRPEFDGNYVQTPVTFTIPAGKRRIKIQRDGFASQVISVSGTIGDTYNMESVVLGPMVDIAMGAVRLETRTDFSGVTYVLEAGLASGEVPADIVDLIVGREYELNISVPNGKIKKNLRCFFSLPESASVEHPLLLSISQKGKRVRVNDCRSTPSGTATTHKNDSETAKPIVPVTAGHDSANPEDLPKSK